MSRIDADPIASAAINLGSTIKDVTNGLTGSSQVPTKGKGCQPGGCMQAFRSSVDEAVCCGTHTYGIEADGLFCEQSLVNTLAATNFG